MSESKESTANGTPDLQNDLSTCYGNGSCESGGEGDSVHFEAILMMLLCRC